MAAVPILIAAASLGYSLVMPEFEWSKATHSSRSSSPLSNLSESSILGCGVVIGMGLSSLLNYEIRKRRLWERLRISILGMITTNTRGRSSGTLLEKYRKPTSIEDVEAKILSSNSHEKAVDDDDDDETSTPCGILQEVVSVDWTFTSHLSVSVITLFPGAKLVRQPASGVEFYYVLKGTGGVVYKKNNEHDDENEVFKLSPGVCFIVDPDSWRGFQATGRSDMVLLRATDEGSPESYDVSRSDESLVESSVALFNVGLNKVEELVKKYSSGGHGPGGEQDIAYV